MPALYLLLLTACSSAWAFHGKENAYLTDALLREVVDRMGRDLAAAADTYLDNSDTGRAMKMLENEDDGYDLEMDDLEPPSLRDQEFLQHSSLWGSQVLGGPGEGLQRAKPDGSILNQHPIKTDPTLPAYCNPPNPCPVGFNEMEGCLEDFENTAAFSRKFQSDQECMCDTEHMFDCPVHEFDSDMDVDMMNEIAVGGQHKGLVAKKFHSKKASNPYLEGEKLPIAAKKGHEVLTG